MTDFSRISPTALIVAYVRQFSGLSYSAEIAQQIDYQSALDAVNHSDPQGILPLAILVEARYRAIDLLLQQQNHRQVLELASGLLPRGLAAAPSIQYIESDLPEMLQQKQAIAHHLIPDLSLNRPNLHFVPLDVTHDSCTRTVEAYFQCAHPVSVICEGLLQYLSFDEKKLVFRNVRSLLETYGGAWITTDFSTKERRKMMAAVSPELLPLLKAVGVMTGRSFENNSFDDFNQVQRFIADQGFSLQSVSLIEVLPELRCLESLNLPRSMAEGLLAVSQVCCLRLI
jgi:O-methyltransferase involved in polyketide biosynthesis